MAVEVVVAVGLGLAVWNPALLAFGGDSVVELASAFIVFGHLKGDAGGSTESGRRTAAATTLLLFALVPVIGLGTAYSYLLGVRPGDSLLGIAVAAGAALIMPYLWLEKRKIGKETACLPLSVDAVESAACFLMAMALLAGLLAEYFFGLWWADYAATAVILALVAKEALASYHELSADSMAGGGLLAGADHGAA